MLHRLRCSGRSTPLCHYLDEQLSPRIAAAARQLMPGIDVTSAQELGHLGWTDQAQLDCATGEGRIIITEDRKDFAPLARRYTAAGVMFTGILLRRGSWSSDEYARIASAIVRFAREHPDRVEPAYCDYLRADDTR